MNRRLAQLFTLSLVFLIAGAMSVSAQVPTGSIVGTVLDEKGAAVEGAQITITSEDTGTSYITHTGSSGGYEVASLIYGRYRVDAQKDGFKIGTVQNIKLDASTQHSVPPITLQVGSINEVVTVEAGDTEQVQTSSAEVTQIVDAKQLETLPILDRSPMGMIQMEPGITNNGRGDTVIDGQRSTFTSMTIDGINIQDNFIRTNDTDFTPNLPFLSQTGEFTLNTQNGDPSVGGGASAISIVTPRGTNNWHGEGFWYYRSNKWAANDWFANAEGIPIFTLNQNQGGGNIGGPILKNKLFVYGYYEFLQDNQSTQELTRLLSSQAASGAFQYHTDCGGTSTPACPAGVVPGQLISANLLTLENTARGGASPVFTIDPAIASLLKRIPSTAAENTTRAGDGLNVLGFAFNARRNNTLRNPGIRVDYILSEHNTLSGTYEWNQQIADRPDIDATFDLIPIITNNDKINFTSDAWRWSPNSWFTNEVRFGMNFAPANFNTTQQFGQRFITGTDFTNPDPNFFAQGRDTRTYSYQDNASMLKGNHSIIFGFQLQRVTTVPFNFAGVSEDEALGFSSGNTFSLTKSDFASLGDIPTNILSNANALLSTLGGFVSTTTQTFNATSATSGFVPGADNIRHFAQNDWSIYGGDSWRMRKNLVLTYGLRWEYLQPLSESSGLLLEPIVPSGETVQQALLGQNTSIAPVSGNTGVAPYGRDLRDFAPNFGVAWDPWGDGKTSIRAGYSIHYVNDDLIASLFNASNNNPGFSATPTNTNVVATVSGVNSLPTVPALATPPFGVPTTILNNYNNLGPASSVAFIISPTLRTPYVQDWNLTFQRELGWKTTLTVGYLGNHGTKLLRVVDYNQVTINSNGFLADFNRARNNCFLSIAAGQGCNANFSGPGSQPLTIFPTLPGDGFLGAGIVQSEIEEGEVGELANLYHENGIEAFNGQFTPSEFVLVGDDLQNFSSSSYNAGYAQVRRRFASGLILQASYTWSKVLDDFDGTQNNVLALLDNGTPQIERGRASFDVTNSFKANFTYNLPFGQGQRWSSSNKAVNEIIGGWNTSSIFTWQSGAPWGFISGRGTLNRNGRSSVETPTTTLSAAQIRSNVNTTFPSGGPFAGDVLLINPSFIDPNTGLGAGPDGLTCSPLVANGFCNPQPGQLGNMGRNQFTGPTFFNWDLAVYKVFPIRESMSFEIRGEGFNVLNHPVFFIGNQNINSTTFGQITSTNSVPRVVQIGATFKF